MEMSCDERVLRKMGGETKKDYSLSLLSLATERRFISTSPLAFGESGVKQRIKNVLNFRKPSRIIVIAAVLLAVILTFGFAVNRAEGTGFLRFFQPMSMKNVHNEPHFSGVITEVHENSILVRVNEGEAARLSSDLIYVSLDVKLKDSISEWFIGDEVTVYYDGEILETYPAQVNNVYAIVIVDNSRWQLTLDEVRMLAAKGDDLQYSDLPNLRPSMLSSVMGGYNPTLYGVEGGYRLLINFNDTMNPESGIRSTALERIWDNGGSGIDIRYNDVDDFIRANPSYPASLYVGNFSYIEAAALINASQEEVYRTIGIPHETLNGTNIYIIDGKRISITYDENNHVNHINYNGEAVVNSIDRTLSETGQEAHLITPPSQFSDTGNDTVNLTLGRFEVRAEELAGHRLYTNSTQITVSIPRSSHTGTFYLYDTQYLTDPIMQFELNQSECTKTFTGLTSAKIYLLMADGLDGGVTITISD